MHGNVMQPPLLASCFPGSLVTHLPQKFTTEVKKRCAHRQKQGEAGRDRSGRREVVRCTSQGGPEAGCPVASCAGN